MCCLLVGFDEIGEVLRFKGSGAGWMLPFVFYMVKLMLIIIVLVFSF